MVPNEPLMCSNHFCRVRVTTHILTTHNSHKSFTKILTKNLTNSQNSHNSQKFSQFSKILTIHKNSHNSHKNSHKSSHNSQVLTTHNSQVLTSHNSQESQLTNFCRVRVTTYKSQLTTHRS